MDPKVYENLRPYTDEEVPSAMKRIASEPDFFMAMNFIFPEKNNKEVEKLLEKIKTTADLQKYIMHPAIRAIVKKTSSGLSHSGFENLKPDEAYLFISNHRDIFLDAGLLQILLFEHGLPTSEIAFGSNLMSSPLIINAGKSNKMFTAYRGGHDKKEVYENTRNFSEYIRFTITQKKRSVWISQRDGRTKDGHDKTEMRLMKILNMSSKGDIINSFRELRIIPVSVSYEYEPCDVLKIKELYESMESPYIKRPGEDFKSILTGITQPKGHIHLGIGKPVNHILDSLQGKNQQEQFQELTAAIDREVYKNYRIWPANYIASDLLAGDDKYSKYYTNNLKEKFKSYTKEKLTPLGGNADVFYRMFLEIYSGCVENLY